MPSFSLEAATDALPVIRFTGTGGTAPATNNLDGGIASTSSFTINADGGIAGTTVFTIDYNGGNAQFV